MARLQSEVRTITIVPPITSAAELKAFATLHKIKTDFTGAAAQGISGFVYGEQFDNANGAGWVPDNIPDVVATTTGELNVVLTDLDRRPLAVVNLVDLFAWAAAGVK